MGAPRLAGCAAEEDTGDGGAVAIRGDFDGRWADLGEFIRSQRRVAQMSLRRLAELAGVSNPYLSQIERGLRRPSAEILQQIARALRIQAETLYVRAGILDDDRDDELSVMDAINRDPFLTPVHKQTLVRVYESFRAEVAAPVPTGARVADGER